MTTTTTARRSPAKALRAVTMAELMDHPFKPREHLLWPWLRQGESAMVWAATGLGKTMLSISMALAVAGGGEFLGWRNETPRKVLIVEGEMHAEDLRDRLALLLPAIAGCDRETASANLTLLSRQHQDGGSDFPDLASPEGQQTILAQITKAGAELVILDNFSTLAEVADENEASAMSPVLRFLQDLKQRNVACILVHHSGKGGKDFRGSSKLATTFEVILGLTAWDGVKAGAGTTFETEWTKFRGKRIPAVQNALVKLSEHEDGRAEWVSEPSARDDIQTLITALQTGCFTTAKELAASLGWDPSKVTNMKARADREGRMSQAEFRAYLDGASEARMDNAMDGGKPPF